MERNKRLIAALNRAIEICPDVELVKFMHYMTSIDNPAYMTDDDLAFQIENYNELAEADKDLHPYHREPNDVSYFDRLLGGFDSTFYDFTKENEEIAYQRYKKYTDGKVFVDLTETVNMKDFLERFTLIYAQSEDYKDITVVNHRDEFVDCLCRDYRHMIGYVVARKGDKYIAKHIYLVKVPCFGELMSYVMQQCKSEYDECLAIAIDWEESPRFTDYTRHILYGLEYNRNTKVVEIFNENRTIEKFHEFFQKANKIISNWDGVLYDDGTCDLE